MKFFESKLSHSLIHSENTTKAESIFGYFIGPCLTHLAYSSLAGNYLTQFYTDVLNINNFGFGATVLTLMPFLSKIISSLVGLFLGRMIDKTNTPQGKARPWILVSGILITAFGLGMYAVPRLSIAGQIIWVIISYNLFFSFGFSVYNLAHMLMVPLSTRNTKQRDSLAMLTSTSTAMIPGMMTTVIMPYLIRWIGVGDSARGSWLMVMGIISCVAIPATLLEYYFTMERVTQEKKDAQLVSFKEQFKACFRDRYWLTILFVYIFIHLASSLTSSSLIYFANWVVGSSVESGTHNQLLLNVVGQGPMGFGLLILWPLVRKIGKEKVAIIGFLIAGLSSIGIFFAGSNLRTILIFMMIRSIGTLPTYCMSGFLAEALDHVERQFGFRTDGFTASITAIIFTVASGIGQTVLLGGINALGYIAPSDVSEVIQQPEALQTFFKICFSGFSVVGYGVASLLLFLNARKSHKTDGNLKSHESN